MHRSIKTLILGFAIVATCFALVPTVQAVELPDQLVKFLPANPEILMVVPSVQEVDRAWNEVRALAADFAEEGDEPLPSLEEVLGEKAAEFYAIVDQERPIALAVSAANVMGGQDPLFYGIIPIKDSDLDLEALALEFGAPTLILENGYLLVSQDPEFVPAATTSKLLAHLPQGTMLFCVDLARLWGTFSPMLDFALMSATTPPAPADGETQPSEPVVTPEQTMAMGDMVRIIMESADVLAMGMDLRDKTAYLSEEFIVLPGSSLAPPAQPVFRQALELTRLLPPDADWSMAYSLEMGGILELYKDFYLTALEMQYADLAEQTGLNLAEFMEAYFQSLDLVMAPTAMALDLDRQAVKAQYVMQTSEVQAIIDMQNHLMDLFSEGGPMLKITQVNGLKVEGLEVHAWDYEWDLESLMTMAAASVDSSDAPEAEELAKMAIILQEFLPGMRMVSKDDLLFVNLGTDLSPLTRMVQQASKGRGEVHPGLAKLAQEAGPDCQGVFQGDLGVILTMIFEIAEEVSGEDLASLKIDPMLMSYALKINDRSYGMNYQVDLKGMAGFIAAMEELEDKHR